MGVIEKALNYLLEKSGLQTILSFILAFLVQVLVPNDTYKTNTDERIKNSSIKINL